MGQKYKIVFIFLFFVVILLTFVFRSFGQGIYPVQAKVIEVVNTPPAEQAPIKDWNFLDKLTEAKNLVASSSLNLKVGKKDIVYYERRISLNSQGVPTFSSKKIKDPERDIALVLIDMISGDLKIVTINEKGNQLTYPSEYEILNKERPNGITNNAWNTCREVLSPANQAVILNVWPHYVTIKVAKPIRNKSGKVIRTTYTNKEIVENVVYAPYCDQIHIPEFVENGKKYRENTTEEAFNALREREVMSKSFPGRLVADVRYLKPEYFERLPLVEHMDYGEFTLDSKRSAERVDVILGTNTNLAYNLTCSGKKACGWLQYTKTTWNSMRKKYPSAKLPVFETGVADHLNSMVAAILLHDTNLASAIKEFGPGILEDENQLEEMLAANYNGGTLRPYKALKASILKSLEDWLINPMRTETKQYIEKVRYVRENYN